MTIEEINRRVMEKSQLIDRIEEEVSKVVVGQHYMIKRMLIGLLADGHILLEGVPGLAKTLAVNTVANTIKADFKRVQFTPDLLPADLVGTLIFNQKTGEFVPKKGPLFAHFVLADEINRAPAKVQSALLEAMQERQVSIGDKTHLLDEPFLVLATQNPIEQEGTYPLPEAQVDRFMLKVVIDYPNKEDELEIIKRMAHSNNRIEVMPVVQPEDLKRAKKIVDKVYIDEKIHRYIVDIVFATRQPKLYNLSNLSDLIQIGASPRASIYLAMAGKAKAFIEGRGYVTPEDIRDVMWDILRHRIILTFEAEAEEVTTEKVIRRIIDTVEVP